MPMFFASSDSFMARHGVLEETVLKPPDLIPTDRIAKGRLGLSRALVEQPQRLLGTALEDRGQADKRAVETVDRSLREA